jgi:hypothetical protein
MAGADDAGQATEQATDNAGQAQTGADTAATILGGAAADKGAEQGKQDAGGAADKADTPWHAALKLDPEKDKELVAFASRFKSPDAMARAAYDLRKQVSSGALKRGLPENATQADLAAWRKDNGIPEAPAGYMEALPATMTLSEADKAAFTDFASVMHTQNAPPAVVAKAMEWYASSQAKAAEARAAADRAAYIHLDNELSGEWGAEKNTTVKAADAYLASQLGEDRFALYEARLSDGTQLGTHPGFVRLIAKIAADMDGGFDLDRGTGGSIADIDKRLAELNAMQNHKDKAVRDKYWSAAIQSEELDLITRKERAASRSKAA